MEDSEDQGQNERNSPQLAYMITTATSRRHLQHTNKTLEKLHIQTISRLKAPDTMPQLHSNTYT